MKKVFESFKDHLQNINEETFVDYINDIDKKQATELKRKVGKYISLSKLKHFTEEIGDLDDWDENPKKLEDIEVGDGYWELYKRKDGAFLVIEPDAGEYWASKK